MIAVKERIRSYPSITLNERSLADIEMIAIGAYSPLQGFLTESDYKAVVSSMRLSDGALWPLPIVLPVSPLDKKGLRIGGRARLVYQGATMAMMQIESIFTPDKSVEARQVYQTEDLNHPGVAALKDRPETLVGGKIEIVRLPPHVGFEKYNLTPADTRRLFQSNGWKKIVGFQTRNPMHRGHEYLTKLALEKADGLFIHPVVGGTKENDWPAEVRVRAIETLIRHYYPQDKVVLGIYPGNMFYAGPREAVLHAIVRQNYGCTHFIVGRDHAGVGSYYSSTAAQELISSFSRQELPIEPLLYEEQVGVSGTKVREMIKAGKVPPPDVLRPEVSKILFDYLK